MATEPGKLYPEPTKKFLGASDQGEMKGRVKTPPKQQAIKKSGVKSA